MLELIIQYAGYPWASENPKQTSLTPQPTSVFQMMYAHKMQNHISVCLIKSQYSKSDAEIPQCLPMPTAMLSGQSAILISRTTVPTTVLYFHIFCIYFFIYLKK